jgi:putative ABC transport system permease protein
VFYQVLAEFAGSLLIGIPCGIIFDKLMFLLFQNITGMDLQLGFSISLDAVLQTVYVTAVCFALIYVLDCIDLFSRKTAELLKGSQTGQKPVKNRWILALLSLLLLGTGYALALSIKDPVEAINWFFIAVLLVIAGTYLFFLFFAGVFVSLLQKNKAYYYKPNHFISVALMRHRITQNAMSLATLCVLSTMILVATSSCVSMIAGAQAQIEKQFPRNTVTSVTTFRGLSTAQSAQTDIALLKQSADDLGLKQEDPLSFYGIRSYTLQTPGYENSEAKIYEEIFTMPLSSYNAVAQEKLSLDSNQQAVYNLPVTGNDIELSQFLPAINAVDFYGLSSLRVVSDAAFEQLIENWQDLGDLAALTSVYAFDTAGYDSYSEEELTDIRTLLTDNVAYPLRDMQPESTTLVQSDFQSLALKTALSLYASVLFIGVFISIALAVFMILLMYYKQISEAMEDRSRFEILQKAGLEKKSVRKIISDQVLLLFFLPLFMAGMHLLFAFPMIRRILALMSSTDPLQADTAGLLQSCLHGCKRSSLKKAGICQN